MLSLQIMLSEDLIRQLLDVADMRRNSFQDIVVIALLDWLKETNQGKRETT